MRPHRRLLACSLLLTSCSTPPAALPPKAETRLTPATTAPVAPPSPTQQPTDFADGAQLTYLRNGNLLVLHQGSAYLFDGSRWYSHVVAGTTTTAARLVRESMGDGESILVDDPGARSPSTITQLSTTDLHVLFQGSAYEVDAALVLVSPPGDTAVVLEHAGRTIRLELPATNEPHEIAAVATHDDIAVVTWHATDSDQALAFRLSTGEQLASAAPMLHRANDPVNALHGTQQLYIAATSSGPPRGPVFPTPSVGFFEEPYFGPRSVVVRDLVQGKTLRQRAIACPRDFLGHPLVSHDGQTIVVLCGARAHVLDATTLSERRRIDRVLGHCPTEPPTLRLLRGAPLVLETQVCGSIARLDLGSGSFRCRDDDTMRPAVPRCSPSATEELLALGTTGTYAFDPATHRVYSTHGTPLSLEPGAGVPTLSGTEDRLAYLVDHQVRVVPLPPGPTPQP